MIDISAKGNIKEESILHALITMEKVETELDDSEL